MKEAADTKETETNCPACNGTGYPVVLQPVQPGRKIYPAKCKNAAVRDEFIEGRQRRARYPIARLENVNLVLQRFNGFRAAHRMRSALPLQAVVQHTTHARRRRPL